MPPEDTTVTAVEEPKPTGSGAFDAARASIGKSADQAEPAPSDDTSKDEKPAEDPVAADQPKEPADEDALLTPEELAALPAKERAKAEKWQAKLTQKAQSLAAQGKEFDRWKPLITELEANPDAALTKLAEQRGLKLTPRQDTTVESKTTEQMAELPEEWQFMKPVFEAYGKKLLDSVRGEIAPVKEAHERMTTEAVAAETESTLERFTAKYPDWKKHEAKMLEIGTKFIPKEGSMSDFEYMETLRTLATAGISEAEKTKTVIAKINKAAENVEPNTSGMQQDRVVHTMPPPGKRDMRAAWEAAKRGEVWQK